MVVAICLYLLSVTSVSFEGREKKRCELHLFLKIVVLVKLKAIEHITKGLCFLNGDSDTLTHLFVIR